MSWFIAAVPKSPLDNDTKREHLVGLLRRVSGMEAKLSVAGREMIVLGGGDKDTFMYGIEESRASGWLVCGAGIKHSGDSFSFMDKEDWRNLVDGGLSKESLRHLNGHFVVASWHGNTIRILCDRLELRRAYAVETRDCFVISPRVDWVSSMMKEKSFDLAELSTTWTLKNSLSSGSFVRNVTRIGPSGEYFVSGQRPFHEWSHFTPNQPVDLPIDSLVKGLALFPLKCGRKVTLGLSGGMDSRTLLAILSKERRENWQVHTCGETGNPDIPVARKLSSALQVRHLVEYFELPESLVVDELIKALRDYVLQTEMSDSPFGFQKLDLFSRMKAEGYVMIDGGYGELFRRSYGNIMQLTGSRAIADRNASGFTEYYLMPRSRIFNDDIHRMFASESVSRMRLAMESMPAVRSGDVGNWIDLFHVRYRLKNYAGGSQGLYDQHITSFMPFAQPVVIDSYLSGSSNARRNNKLNRRIIRAGDSSLTHIPLVASGGTVPFRTSKSMILSRALGRFNRILKSNGKSGVETFRRQVLNLLKDFIIDRSTSSAVIGCELYDQKALKNNIEEYFRSGDKSCEQFIEDWLIFDFWREEVA